MVNIDLLTFQTRKHLFNIFSNTNAMKMTKFKENIKNISVVLLIM